MFKKILVATDLNEASRHAVAAAVRLAREQQASLHIVNVVLDPTSQPWAAEAYGIDLADMVDDMRRRGLQAIRRMIGEIKPPLPLVQPEVLVGPPATEIVRYAREHGIDLIVVGTHGRGPIRRAFVGSVAERVLREAACPVLIVRRKGSAARLKSAA